MCIWAQLTFLHLYFFFIHSLLRTPFLFFWRSSSGAQQGDPLASLLFALVYRPLLRRINELCPKAFASSTPGFMTTAQSSFAFAFITSTAETRNSHSRSFSQLLVQSNPRRGWKSLKRRLFLYFFVITMYVRLKNFLLARISIFY